MEIRILAFGIAKDIFGKEKITVTVNENNARTVKTVLEEQYPRLKELASYMIAVNNEYAGAETVINETDEVAVIPPVSGG